jgi:hypothetical protein
MVNHKQWILKKQKQIINSISNATSCSVWGFHWSQAPQRADDQKGNQNGRNNENAENVVNVENVENL